ncbi:MAG TPA: hypothetical protein VJZ71_20220 [Phycisphaerae bacterium]|nr:hypothetical protein [Phycisphaerae bacterium]
MNHDTRRQARWAGHLHAGLQRLGRGKLTVLSDEIGRLGAQLERVRQLRLRLMTCLERGWQAAARDVRRELDYTLGDIDRATTQCDQLLRRNESTAPTPRFVFDELRQLHDEFDEIKFDAEHAMLSVTTEPITLEGIRLGRFEIRLELGGHSDADPASFLRIVALEPNPASCDSTVTHPHVRDERICLGEAAAPIQQALADGRVCDLFILVRSVLQTYNADSPFISLAKWDGRPCHDCGYSMDDEESYWCEGCEHDFCDQCVSCCRSCDQSYCKNCLRDCAICGNAHCEACLRRCRACEESVCAECLKEDVCTTCQEDKEHEDASNDQGSDSKAAQGGGNEDDPSDGNGNDQSAGRVDNGEARRVEGDDQVAVAEAATA